MCCDEQNHSRNTISASPAQPFAQPFVQASAQQTTNLCSIDLPPVVKEDINYGLAHLDNGLCYQMLAVGGQVLRLLKGKQGAYCFALPRLCKDCRGAELARVLNQVLPANVAVDIGTQLLGKQPVLRQPAVPFAPHHPQARIGICGNAAMLLTPEFNDQLIERIREEGALPVLPNTNDLFNSKKPLTDFLPQLYAQGIRDFIFAQSFGCLRSHVDARGVLPQLKQHYPNCNITFLEYDPGISQINQISRLKLAVSIAFERIASHPF